MVGPARRPFGKAGGTDASSGVSGRTRRETGPIRGLRSTRAIRRDPTGSLGPFGERGRGGRLGDQRGRRSSGRHPSELLREPVREVLPDPTGRTPFAPSGAKTARQASANRAGAEGPSGPFGPNHRLRAAARKRSHAEDDQRGIPAPSGKGSGTGSASAGPEPYGTSSDDPAEQASSEARKVCLAQDPGCFSGRPGAAAVPGPQPGRSRGVLGQNGSGCHGIGPDPRARSAEKALRRFHRWSHPSPDGYYRRTHTRVWNPINGPRSAVKVKDKEPASAVPCGCVARATVPASVGSDAAGACGQEGPRLRTRASQTALRPNRPASSDNGRQDRNLRNNDLASSDKRKEDRALRQRKPTPSGVGGNGRACERLEPRLRTKGKEITPCGERNQNLRATAEIIATAATETGTFG